jgi:hypothetical protein
MIEARFDDQDSKIQLRKSSGSCCASDSSTRNDDVVCHRLRPDGDTAAGMSPLCSVID